MDAADITEDLTLNAGQLLKVVLEWLEAVASIIFIGVAAYRKERFDSYIIFKINSQHWERTDR